MAQAVFNDIPPKDGFLRFVAHALSDSWIWPKIARAKLLQVAIPVLQINDMPRLVVA